MEKNISWVQYLLSFFLFFKAHFNGFGKFRIFLIFQS